MSIRQRYAIRKQIKSSRREPQPWPAVVGDGQGVIEVPGHPEYWYVRPMGSDLPIPVIGGGAPKKQGARVWVGHDRNRRRILRILGIDTQSSGGGGESQSVDPHGPSHLANASDPAPISPYQIVELGLTVVSGMIVRIAGGAVTVNRQPAYVTTTNIDLTSHVPGAGAGARWVLIRADDTGALSVQDGDLVDSYADLTQSNWPAVAAGYKALWVVRLYEGQTAVSSAWATIDYYPIWYAEAGGGSGTDTTAIHIDVAGEIAGLTAKATSVDADLAMIEDSAAGNAKRKVTLLSILQSIGAAIYAPIAKGVTNGDSHDHSGGDGAQIDHGGLAGLTDDDHTNLHNNARGDARYSPHICQGRLTLESGVPVSVTDQSAKTTVYFTPYKGNKIALYSGTAWDLVDFSEISISLAGKAATRLYDIFCYNNAGTATLETAIWTNTTTRDSALGLQDGVLVKNAVKTRRYLGTIYINSSGGQTDDTLVKRNVWNYYNRVLRPAYTLETTAHYYNGAFRLWNNSETNNRIEVLVGWPEDAFQMSLAASIKAGTDGAYAQVGVAEDGTLLTAPLTSVINMNNQYVGVGSAFPLYAGLGFHYFNVQEYGNDANSRFSNCMISVGVLG